jgi:HlyD family secretion protein
MRMSAFSIGLVKALSSPQLLIFGAFSLLLLLPLSLLAGCSSKEEGEPAPTLTVQVAVAEKKPIESVISADAILYPREEAAIVPQISAPVRKFFVDRGSRVRAGQILAELEDRNLLATYTENQGGVQQAEAAYQTALEKTRQDLVIAKEELDLQRKTYQNRQTLLEQGAVSTKDVADAKIALSQAQAQYEAAQKQYDLQAAEGQLTAAQGKSAGAQAELSYAKIVSPISGVITDRPFFPGETAPPGSPLITVMDLSKVTARAHVAQLEASQLKVGDRAQILAPGVDPSLPAKVTFLSPALDPNSNTVEIGVQAENPNEQLRPGTSVRVFIVAQTVPDAIVIPSSALLTASDGSESVYTVGTSLKPQKQNVTVGVRNGNLVEITDGLKAGDKVVTVGAFELDREDENLLAKTRLIVEAPQAPDYGQGAARGRDNKE